MGCTPQTARRNHEIPSSNVTKKTTQKTSDSNPNDYYSAAAVRHKNKSRNRANISPRARTTSIHTLGIESVIATK